tara:strand:+ start:416 stop:646 length:231 start_codon:yes stop_codon:yes gene_type:complete
MSKFNTPKARSNRRRQLERMRKNPQYNIDDDKILDILDYEFDLEMGNYPKMPLPSKRYKNGGAVMKNRGGTFKGTF